MENQSGEKMKHGEITLGERWRDKLIEGQDKSWGKKKNEEKKKTERLVDWRSNSQSVDRM